ERVANTVQGTINGTLLMAALQGTLGGMMFWWLGLPTPLFWGVVMAVLAVIPYLGTLVGWMPPALYLGLDGQYNSAVILAGWGVCVVTLVDNLLSPIVVGKQLHIHPLLAFIGIVGGVSVFGASGVILGPVTLAVAIVLVDIWRTRISWGGVAEEPVEDRE